MADDVVGGLEQASPYEKAQAKYQEQITRLSKIQDDLMASLSTRQGAGNPLLALAQGFLAPTRGGGFGESAGNALQSMGSQQQLEQKQSQENAMMRMQLAQQSLAPYKEQMELARRSSMSGDLKKLLGAGGQTIQGPEAANMARSVEVAPFSNEAASLIGKPSPTASGGNNVFGNIDATTRGLLMSQAGVDPEGVMKELATFGMKESGRTDKMKEMEYFANQFPGADRSKLMQVAAARSLLGDPATLITAIKSTQEMIDQEQDIPTNRAIKAFLLSQLGMYGYGSPAGAAQGSGQPVTPQFNVTPPAIPQIGARPPIPAAAIPAAPATDTDIIKNAPANTRSGQIPRGASLEDAASVLNQSIADPELRRVLLEDYKKGITTSPMSAVQPTVMKTADTGEGPNKRERELRQAADIKKAELEIVRQSALENTWSDDNQRARDEIRDARTVHQTVNDNKDGFGLLSKPGSALAYAAQAGFRIGDKSVGINELEQSLLRSGKYTQKEINAVSIVHQIALKWQLAVAAAQKGAASNYERTLFSQAGLNISDNPKIIQYKASLIEAQARNRQEVWNSYQQFKENNKRGNIDQFQTTPEFIKLQKSFDQKLDKIRSAYSQ